MKLERKISELFTDFLSSITILIQGGEELPVENVIQLTDIKTYMMYTIYFENGRTQEEQLEVGCAEDIQNQMEMFFKEQWQDLFSDWYDPFDFMYATFHGITFINSDKNRIAMQIYGNYKSGSCTLDFESLSDKNAQKLKRIREIANE